MHLPLTMKEHMTISLTGGNFQNDSLKSKISGLYCSPVQPQIVHLDTGRVSGSLQTCLEGGHNNQTYDLSQKGSGGDFQKRTMTQSLGSLLSKLAVWARFGQNLTQMKFGPFKNLQGLALCQRCSGGAHDSQKYAQTQNLGSLKSKIDPNWPSRSKETASAVG